MIHRPYFFDNIKHYLFGTLNQGQVDGLITFLDWYDRENPPIPERYHLDDRRLAYILATTFHETARTMQPIEEMGGEKYLKSKPYYPWYGRGYVQLTWEENYKKMDQKLSLHGSLLKDPNVALSPAIAKQIIIVGMVDGDFTGLGLSKFFTDDVTDWYNARKIVNGLDCATEIAEHAEKFLNAMSHV